MKKFFAILLCVALGACALFGCSSDEDSSKKKNPQEESGWTDFY